VCSRHFILLAVRPFKNMLWIRSASMVAVGNKSLKAFQAVAGIFGDEDICTSSRVTGVRRVLACAAL